MFIEWVKYWMNEEMMSQDSVTGEEPKQKSYYELSESEKLPNRNKYAIL